MRKTSFETNLSSQKTNDLMEASTVISLAMPEDVKPDGVTFAWWNDEQLLAYYDSKASKLLNEDDYDHMMYELEKRGLL